MYCKGITIIPIWVWNGFSPLKAIRFKCFECSTGSAYQVKNCNIPKCPLFIYRFGTNPARRGIGGGLRNLNKNLPTQVDRF